jgi:hypothetical protein
VPPPRLSSSLGMLRGSFAILVTLRPPFFALCYRLSAICYWLLAMRFASPYCHSAITVLPSPGMKTLTVKVPDALFAEIAGAAKARNVPKSEIVRERLARKPITSKRASLWSSMEDLVIQEDVLPTDLSSNRKHLKGYGKNRPHR